ncbi:hypothetical protein GJAV_G00236120 [Gymnothorax javanicus]|nr:hypothetical protein GJAV_G00236120 [Gymnothorax javanicus]
MRAAFSHRQSWSKNVGPSLLEGERVFLGNASLFPFGSERTGPAPPAAGPKHRRCFWKPRWVRERQRSTDSYGCPDERRLLPNQLLTAAHRFHGD